VGRRAELEELSKLAEAPGLVTVTGPVGVGKSRLAVEALPGAAVVHASSISEPSAFFDALAVAVGTSGARDPQEAALEGLRRDPRPVIVDDADRLIGSAREIGALADALAESAVVLTSRTRTNIPGERVIDLAPLPPEHAVELLGALAASERGRTFDELEMEDVRALARALDGLPLALELAAARLRVLAPRAIRHRLASRFEILQRAARAGHKHDALEGALDWAWAGLERWEQEALAQCTVFASPFTVEAAEAVLSLGTGAPATLDALTALRDRSLLGSVSSESDVRLTMLASVRDHAIARGGDLATAERRHAEWFVARAEALAGRGELAALREERTEGLAVLARLRSVGATSPERAEIALRVAIALAPMLLAQGPTAEIAALVEPVLAVTARSGANARLQGRAQLVRGLLRERLGDLAAARTDYEAARHLASKFDDAELAIRATANLARLDGVLGHPERGLRTLESVALELVNAPEIAITRAELTGEAMDALRDAARVEGVFRARSLRVRARFADDPSSLLEDAIAAARAEGDRVLEAELLFDLGAHRPGLLAAALVAAEGIGHATLAERCRRAIEASRAPEARLRAPASGQWFELEARVDLGRRKALRLVFARLLRERTRGDASVGWDVLLEAGWPNERVRAEAGQHRVRVAVLTLRKLGLGRHLQTTDDGYRLDPALRVDVTDL
jgi:predicted ATPase